MALQTVRFLVERGADVNAAGEFGRTALHAAAYQGLNDVIEFLAGYGANLDVKDHFGHTPLSISYAIITRDIGDAYHQAPQVFRRDTADLLLKLGATRLDRSGVVGVVHRSANSSLPVAISCEHLRAQRRTLAGHPSLEVITSALPSVRAVLRREFMRRSSP
jgi:ankyrin repeat protein